MPLRAVSHPVGQTGSAMWFITDASVPVDQEYGDAPLRAGMNSKVVEEKSAPEPQAHTRSAMNSARVGGHTDERPSRSFAGGWHIALCCAHA